ncbi:MAG TPA: rhomboid family intramembrane serine protease [Steroidobacteraceae bacterium]|jgi:membrane associated rhomboid family serine protease|nr:rhomboid family intramembrane serine protease [Steroidobacteraceae bacterium]
MTASSRHVPVFPAITLVFCVISAGLSIVSLTQSPLDAPWRALHASDAFRTGAFWLLVVPATLLHSSWHHLLPNLGVGLLLGSAVERRVGHHWFAIALLLCLVLPTGLELLSSGRPQIGISGVDYAFLGFLLANPPSIRRGLWLTIVAILLGWLVAGMLLPISPANPPGNVSHVTGLILGAGAGLLFRRRH